MLVVSDSDYKPAIAKLHLAGFRATLPRRDPAPEVLQMLPDPAKMLRELHAEYAQLDRATTVFDYPVRYRRSTVQMVLMPASYAHLSAFPALISVATEPTTSLNGQYDVYKNVYYPLEHLLLESFIKVIVSDGDAPRMTQWVEDLNVWVGTICGYLDVENDAFDDCPDDAVREWFSEHWGRKREARFGPWDRRISKRLGSGKEMSHDMRRRPIAP